MEHRGRGQGQPVWQVTVGAVLCTNVQRQSAERCSTKSCSPLKCKGERPGKGFTARANDLTKIGTVKYSAHKKITLHEALKMSFKRKQIFLK